MSLQKWLIACMMLPATLPVPAVEIAPRISDREITEKASPFGCGSVRKWVRRK